MGGDLGLVGRTLEQCYSITEFLSDLLTGRVPLAGGSFVAPHRLRLEVELPPPTDLIPPTHPLGLALAQAIHLY